MEQGSLRLLLLVELPISLPEYNRHIAAHLVEQGSLRLLPLAELPHLSYLNKIDTLRRIWWSKAVCASFSLRSCQFHYLNTTDTLLCIWWRRAVCASFPLRSGPISLPEYNRHIAAHLVEQGSLRLLLLAELPRLIALLRPALVDGAAELRNLFLQPLDLCAIGRELLHPLKGQDYKPYKIVA